MEFRCFYRAPILHRCTPAISHWRNAGMVATLDGRAASLAKPWTFPARDARRRRDEHSMGARYDTVIHWSTARSKGMSTTPGAVNSAYRREPAAGAWLRSDQQIAAASRQVTGVTMQADRAVGNYAGASNVSGPIASIARLFPSREPHRATGTVSSSLHRPPTWKAPHRHHFRSNK
jgi:hypothetical protein